MSTLLYQNIGSSEYLGYGKPFLKLVCSDCMCFFNQDKQQSL